jgi:hypothetical protein
VRRKGLNGVQAVVAGSVFDLGGILERPAIWVGQSVGHGYPFRKVAGNVKLRQHIGLYNRVLTCLGKL